MRAVEAEGSLVCWAYSPWCNEYIMQRLESCTIFKYEGAVKRLHQVWSVNWCNLFLNVTFVLN